MLKRVVHSLGLVEQPDESPRRKNKVRGTKASASSSPDSDFVVRIVLQGGQHEVYQHAFPASKLMAKHPGMCVARPEVFREPHQSLLRPEESLLLGHKYIIISSRDLEKLKRKHPQQEKTKENGTFSVTNGVVSQEMVETRITLSPRECNTHVNGEVRETIGSGEEEMNGNMNLSQYAGDGEESYCTAKEFYVPKHNSTRYSRRKGIKGKKPFAPPLPKAKSFRGFRWQPSLATLPELSP